MSKMTYILTIGPIAVLGFKFELICYQNGRNFILVPKEESIYLEAVKNVFVSRGLNNHFLLKLVCERGYFDVINYIISSDYSSIQADLIESASLKGNLDLVKYLISRGCKCSKKSFKYAVLHGNIELVKYLLSIYEKEIDEEIVSGACARGHLHILTYFYSLGFNFKEYQVLMIHAIMSGNLDTIKYLFYLGWDIEDETAKLYSENYGPLANKVYLNLSNKDKKVIAFNFAKRLIMKDYLKNL